MKKIILLLLILILIPCSVFSQANIKVSDKFSKAEKELSNIYAQYNALDDFSPEKMPGFKELDKINQLVEKLDFNKRKFNLLIKQYNLLEDIIFPEALKTEIENPSSTQFFYEKIKEKTDNTPLSIL